MFAAIILREIIEWYAADNSWKLLKKIFKRWFIEDRR